MGIYDRDYYRGEASASLWFTGQTRVTIGLVVANVVVFVGQALWPADLRGPGLTEALKLIPSKVFEDLQVWRLLTATFCHSPGDFWHILWNMVFLWWFGNELEKLYGSREFLIFYLCAAVFSSFAWALVSWLRAPAGFEPSMIGASGAVMAVAVLYTMYYPRQPIYMWGIIRMEMRVMMTIYLVADAYQFIGSQYSLVAHLAHLAGAAYAVVYKWADLRTTRLFAARRSRPRLRVVSPEPEPIEHPPLLDADLEHRMDAVLAKIAREGKASLNDEEREVLSQASRRLRDRRG